MQINVFPIRRSWIPALMIAAVLTATYAQAEVKRSIAVAPVRWTAGTVSWISGEALQAQMITELDKTGRYRVVERENLQGILDEQDLAAGGRMRKGSGAKTGSLEGAQMMIKCVITDAEEAESDGTSGGFGRLGGSKKKTVYRVTMDVRIYDTTTGLILDTATVTTEQVKKKGGGGIGIGRLRLGKSKSKGDTTGEITRDLIKQAIAAVDAQADIVGWKTKVLTVKGDKIIILGGSRDGLEKGMTFTVYELGESLIDEDTGEVLDEGEETEIGTISLTKIKEKVSYASKVTGEGIAKGNVVKLAKAE
jgi:curli biogenesis system outer membrane secretion channel CsgG